MWGQLILALLRVSILGFGGGPSSIPLLHKEVVEQYKWMSNEQFTDVLAVGNALPGPILTKMAGYIGYYLKGVMGAIVAIIISTVPTIIALILLLSLLGSLHDAPQIKGATASIQPVIGVMLAVMAYQMLKTNQRTLGRIVSIAMTISFIAALLLGVHPAIMIVLLLITGASSSRPIQLKRRQKKQQEDGT